MSDQEKKAASKLFDLDALERRATEAISRTYGPMLDDIEARFWAQKGIEGMRLAIAEAQADCRP